MLLFHQEQQVSVDVTADTATFPTPSVISALLAVIVSVSIVVADPVILTVDLSSSCVWMFEVTPSKYPSSTDVTAEAITLPDELDVNAFDVVRLFVTIVEAPPVIVACFASNCV